MVKKPSHSTYCPFKFKSCMYVVNEKRGVSDPMLELTLTSSYLIVDSKVKLAAPTTNADDCFLNYSKK